MAKIGVYVFSNKIKDRGTRKNNYFDSLSYAGLNSILEEIRDEHEIGFASSETLDNFDYVFVSIISYYDVYNFINEMLSTKQHRSKIVVGGAGLTNIRLLKEFIDIAVFGRAEGRVKQILKGEDLSNVWYKEKDPDLKGTYEFGRTMFLIKNKYIQERSVGCQRKCAFCMYSHTHDFVCDKEDARYNSAVKMGSGYEDFFQTFDFDKATSPGVTAMDGVTEEARRKVFKPLTREEFKNKLLEAYKISRKEIRRSVKVFMIIGYPFEDIDAASLEELREDFAKIDKQTKEVDIKMTFLFSHFIPSAFTPMQWERVNLIPYRKLLNNNRTIYRGVNFDAWILPEITTVSSVLEEVFVERAYEKDFDLVPRVILNKKYRLLPSEEKKEVLLKHLPSYIYEAHEPGSELATSYIKPFYPINKIAKNMRKEWRPYEKQN